MALSRQFVSMAEREAWIEDCWDEFTAWRDLCRQYENFSSETVYDIPSFQEFIACEAFFIYDEEGWVQYIIFHRM